MRKLLRANIARLKCGRLLWILIAAAPIMGLIACYNKYQMITVNKFPGTLDEIFFGAYPFWGIALAILASLFIGTEYSDGTIRNKLVVGRKRTDVYLANFITCAAIGAILNLIYLAVLCALGIPLIGPLQMEIARILVLLAVGLLVTVAFAAIFTLVSMLVTSRTISVLVCILGIVAAITGTLILRSQLDEPEFHSDAILIKDNYVQETEPVPNPLYVGPEKRAVYETILDILPTGQAVQLWILDVERPWRMMLCSIAVIVLSNAAGVFFFRRKDLT